MDLFNPSTPLPPWFSEEDLATYASLYEKSGFKFALQVPYRSLVVDSGITDPKVTIPAVLIMGEKDYVFKFPGMEDYIRSGMVKNFVPNLEVIYMPEGSHFIHEQFPEKVNQVKSICTSASLAIVITQMGFQGDTLHLLQHHPLLHTLHLPPGKIQGRQWL